MRLASIDIGSNSVHMIIADVTGPHSFYIIDRERERVKLGAGAFKSGKLRTESVQAALAALKRFALLCKRTKVDRVVAVATSAVREARNGAQFLRTVKLQTGIDAKIISGEEEAELIYRGVRHAADLEGRRGLILDLGGGSLEVMYGNANRLMLKDSLKLGVQRLRDYFGKADPLSRRQRQQLIDHVRKLAGPVITRIRRRGIDTVLCTSGTHLTLGLCCLRLRGRDPWGSLNGYVIRSSELHDLAGTLLDQDAAERTRLPGIDERRADTIHLGAAVLATILDMARAREFQLCGASLREGLLLREIDKLARRRPPANARLDSAFDLIRRTGGDPARARHLASLAVAVFDGSRRAHGLAWRDRELLETAALLEDLGRGLHLHDREHLSYQIIRGGGLRGLSDVELEIVGLTARYSRGGAPKARHRHFAELDPDSQHVVRVLAGILRIADGLDRGRAGAVKSIRCRLAGGVLRIASRAVGDASLELWSAQRATKLFTQTVDVDVVIAGA